MSKKACKFKTGKPGFGCKDGKLYRFEKKSVLVLAPWPEPQAWVKSHRKGWHSSRKRADKVFTEILFPRGDEERHLLDGDPYLRVWTEDPSAPGAEEREDYVRRYGTEQIDPELILEMRAEVMKRRAEVERINPAIQYVRRMQARYFDQIPDEVRTELLRYGSRRWHLLCLYARCPGALDLSRSNPALCYALASSWIFHKPAVKLPMRAARALAGKKQRQILGWLGFPTTEAARRLLQKIDPAALSVVRLLQIREMLANDGEMVQWLSHLPRIDPRMLEIVTTKWYRPLLTGRLLREIDALPVDTRGKPPELVLFRDMDQLKWRLPDAPVRGRFVSMRRLQGYHDELAEMDRRRWEERRASGRVEGPFPLPPFAGTATIRPLRSPDELYREGAEMHHCVGIYGDQVRAGRCYIYQVLEPVRATMQIVWNPSAGKWRPGELQMAGNRKVPEAIAGQLFKELFASGDFVPEESPKMMDADWTPEPAEDDQQMRLFDLEPQGEMVSF